MEPLEKFSNLRGAKMVEVIAVECNEGGGTQNDPVRRTLCLYSKSGDFLTVIGDDVERKFRDGDFMKVQTLD